MHYYAGIDIGSFSAKTVVMDRGRQIFTRFLQPTGWSSMTTANEIHIRMTQDGYDSAAVSVVATGYGCVSVPYAQRCITEITGHGLASMADCSLNRETVSVWDCFVGRPKLMIK